MAPAIGAVLGGGLQNKRPSLRASEKVGLGFQIADDILMKPQTREAWQGRR